MTDVLPGVTVQVAAQALPSGDATATGRLFVAGVTARGPVVPTVVGGFASFRRLFGDRTHFDTLTDPLQAFWAVGGGDVVVSRVVGPAATVATVTVDDGDAVPTVRFDAAWPGDAGDDLAVEVATDGDGFQLIVTDDGRVVEVYRRLGSVADAVLALSQSELVRAVDLASVSSDPTPEPGVYQLAGGDDDRANINDQAWKDALDRIDGGFGPGQVAAPGRTSQTGHDQLVDLAAATNRVAYLDGPQGADAAALTAIALGENRRQAALFGPWLNVPLGERIVPVPASMVAAGVTARLDRAAPTAHLAPTLERARLVEERSGRAVVVSVDVDFTDAEHAALNSAGANVFRATRSGVLLRGWRSLSNEPQWVQLSQVRYVMGLSARLADISERFVFATLTRTAIAEYGAQLKSELLADFEAGALFGDVPDDAYAVDVSEDVNPAGQLQQGILHALVDVTPAPFAERIVIDILKRNLA